MYKLITVAALFGSAAAEIVAYDPSKCTVTGEALATWATTEEIKTACGPCVGASASEECSTWFNVFENALACGDNAHCVQKAEKEAAAKAAADKAAADKAAADKKAAEEKAAADKKAAEEKAAADAKAAALAGCPTDKAKCTNANGYCATWAKDNQCVANSEWMIPNCAGSCCPLCNGEADAAAALVCPAADKSASCKTDSRTSCAKWAEKGECEKNAKWMIPNCQASCCDTCNRAANGCPAVKKLCSDDYDAAKCAAWAEKGECTKNPKFMNKNCSKSCCSLCAAKPPATATAPVASTPIYNSYNNFGYNSYNPYGSYATGAATLPYSGYGGLNTGLNTGLWGR